MIRAMSGLAAAGFFALFARAAPAGTPAAIIADPAGAPGRRASMEVMHIPTHGMAINGVLYRAAGDGAHPTLVLYHGLPGNEQNLDLAQAVRRDGWNVLTLHYRGSWGSPGAFSFAHVLEDAQAALDFIRDPAVAAKYGVDRTRIAVAGHSMGGMAAAVVGGDNPGLAGVVLISAWNMGADARLKSGRDGVIEDMDQNRESLATTPQAMADELIARRGEWNFLSRAPGLARHPLLVVTSDDGLAATDGALAAAVAADGGRVVLVHMTTDHSYSDRRIALESAVIDFLDTLAKPR
ncbi:MAG TPA: alpha/beta fold hydrolase [Caulobacteraceae bacterium]|jgi:acetyl esterase/lipase|nr:alpha/beta fold hydrolase [Caulobacteraceae bacterium]